MIDKYFAIHGKFTVDKLVKLLKEKALEINMEANTMQKISEYTRLQDFIKNEGSLSRRKIKGGSRKFSIAIT